MIDDIQGYVMFPNVTNVADASMSGLLLGLRPSSTIEGALNMDVHWVNYSNNIACGSDGGTYQSDIDLFFTYAKVCPKCAEAALKIRPDLRGIVLGKDLGIL